LPFRTVMAYRCATVTCPRVLQFSSPRVADATTGRVTGTPLQDNASSLGEAFPLVAGFRASVVPLAAPGGVHAGVSGFTATITWQPVPDATGYTVEVGTAPGAANLFAGAVGPATAAGAVLPPGTYYARVRAVRGAEMGPPSSEVVAAVAAPPPPAAPDRLEVVVDGRTVWLSWPPPAGGASGGYRLEAGYAPGTSDAAVAVVAGSPVVIANAPPGTYYLRVRAVGPAGAGPPSPDAIVTVR
jgi:hypothetical protein